MDTDFFKFPKSYLLIINFLLPFLILANPTADSLRLLQTLPVRATFAATDNLSNVYLITPDNAIEKYAPDGRRLARYTNNRLGQATRLDVSNPLKVLVWYADFRTALFLDRSLTDLGELNLITAGFPEVRTVAAALDGNMWLYDEVNFRLVKITPEGEKRYESQSMNLSEATPNRPTCLREGNDRVLLADSTQGVFVFDLFAQFDRLLVPQHPVTDFQIVDNQIHYLADGKIIAEHLQVRASREVAIPAEMLKEKTALLSGGRLLLLGEKVEVWGY
ncbi:MAG: hypothetical protein OHK0019_16830 [Saprospiraceae bacterium]